MSTWASEVLGATVATIRLNIRVYPGAHRTEVGGRYGNGEPPVLVVRVNAPAVDGRANQAVIEALSSALGVRKSAIRIAAGASSRTKVVEVFGIEPGAVEYLLVR